MRHQFTVSLLLVLLFSRPAFSQTLDRYSYRREVTIQTLKGNKVTSTLIRRSFFSFDDLGRRSESEVELTGKSKLELSDFDWRTFRDAQIITHWPAFTDHGDIWTSETLRATLWRCDQVDHNCGQLSFPVYTEATGAYKGRRIKLTIRYSDYRLFRTSVVIKDVSE